MSIRSRTLTAVGIFALATALLAGGFSSAVRAQDNSNGTTENEAALAQYADAANFQTNGELQLAIEEWKKFLTEFGDDPLAPKAAHYLGVCYMQLPEPQLAAAAKAFQQALKAGDKYELREESLSNLGWCQFALGSAPEKRDDEALRQSIATFKTLLKENPSSRFVDRAVFYMGEAYYALGEAPQAVAAYDALLQSAAGANSALRCDAMYAKGVALEDLKQYDEAIAVYEEMLKACGDSPLASDARLHMAEVFVLQKRYEDAEAVFAKLAAEGGEMQPRAIIRRAFVLAQMNRSDEAARLYESVIKDFPDSPFAASALMAAAQSHYRAGQMEEAAARFRQVIESQTNLESATEAAHWLSVMALRQGDVVEAERIAREQIARGLGGSYKTLVRLDAAEARSMQPGKQAEALAEFDQLLADSPDDALMPRILYNAAFTALQIGQADKALQLTSRFAERFASDPLTPDMRYIAAEANLRAGNAEQAIAEYKQLLESADKSNPQFSLWVLRAANAMLSADQNDQAIAVLQEHAQALTAPAMQAEAQFLIGTAHLAAERTAPAIEAFEQALKVDPQWQRSEEALFRLAAAHQAAGDREAAARVWQQLIDRDPEAPIADQARYRIAQQQGDAGEYAQAIATYDALLREGGDSGLRPFALYWRGWAEMQRKQYAEAIEPLTEVVDQYEQHALREDALLARGICHHRLDQQEQAVQDLQAFLALEPQGINLGHGLYELALIDRQAGRPAEAASKLRRIVNEIPDYPDMQSVQYELAWALKDADQDAEATEVFTKLASTYPDSPQAAEASYYVGQHHYAAREWAPAAEAYARAAASEEPELREKSLYRLGWCYFQQQQMDPAVDAFEKLLSARPDGKLAIDARMMIGECRFSSGQYEAALAAYEQARETILQRDGENRKFTDPAEQQVRELVFLHGGQSASQLEQWEAALRWYAELRSRYPSSKYLPQVFYETGFVHQQMGNDAEAMKFYTETADTFRNESAARARFMMGELLFKQNKPAEAITEFKRVMYGFGAEKAPPSIQDWQAKSGFEAGRCAELLVQANEGERRQKAIDIAKRYYQYVIDSHASHALAAKAKDRLQVLDRM